MGRSNGAPFRLAGRSGFRGVLSVKRAISRYWIVAVVAAAAAIVYLPALRGEFVEWDDAEYVTENFHIRALNLAFVKWAFLGFHASNWHPLTWVSHALDFAFWGLNPAGHHLTSVILHALNTLLVGLLAARWVEAGGGSAGEARSRPVRRPPRCSAFTQPTSSPWRGSRNGRTSSAPSSSC